MMSDNLAKLGHFKAAHDICTSLLAQGRDYMDEGTRTAFETNAVLFGLKSQWPRMGISYAVFCLKKKIGEVDQQYKYQPDHKKQTLRTERLSEALIMMIAFYFIQL